MERWLESQTILTHTYVYTYDIYIYITRYRYCYPLIFKARSAPGNTDLLK